MSLARSFTTAAVLLALALTGCDGHVEMLYLRPPGANRPPLLVSKSNTLPVREDEDVVGIVSRVSADMGLAPEPQTANAWQKVYTRYDDVLGYFWVRVQRDKAGYWRVALIDFPILRRSEYSRTAEQMIRAALREEEVAE